MNQFSRIIVACTLLTVLVGCSGFGGTAEAAEVAAKVGGPAPDFSLPDVAGTTHKLSDYRGKVVVLEWVNYHCPFVKKHYDSKNMQALQKKWTGKEVVWLAICSSAPGKQGNFDPAQAAKEGQSRGAAHTAYLLDPEGQVGRSYGAKTTPHMFIIDPKGKLVYQGAIDSIKSANQKDIKKATNYVDTGLTALLAGKPLKPQTTQPYGCSVKY